MNEFATNGVNPYSTDRCKNCPSKHYCSMNRLICKEYQQYLDNLRNSLSNLKTEGTDEE